MDDDYDNYVPQISTMDYSLLQGGGSAQPASAGSSASGGAYLFEGVAGHPPQGMSMPPNRAPAGGGGTSFPNISGMMVPGGGGISRQHFSGEFGAAIPPQQVFKRL